MSILSAHQQKIMPQNNNIYPSLITMLLVYLAYSELRFQFQKKELTLAWTLSKSKQAESSNFISSCRNVLPPTDSVTALSAASLVTHGRRENLSFLFVHLFVPVWS